jgi:hypothetical protein
MLIAVSSFGESLRRVLPHRPGGGEFNGLATRWSYSEEATGNTTINVEPLPWMESTQMRP